MSVISSPLPLLLLLLCTSFHACNGRRLGAILAKDLAEHARLPNKISEEKVTAVRTSLTRKAKPAMSTELHGETAIDGGSMVKQNRVNKDDHKPINSFNPEELKSSQGGKMSGADQQKDHSRPSFSDFHVPLKKRGERQPGFNLDYVPPMDHTPTHN